MERHIASQELERYLSNTQEFMQLKKVQLEINKNPKINKLITQFQTKQRTLYTQKLTQEQIQKTMDELDSEYKNLSSIPIVKQYFHAVDQFNIIVNQLMKDINASLEKQLL